MNVATAGSISADMTAGGNASVTSVGDVSGEVLATDGDAAVPSFQDVTEDVTAGGNAAVTAWGNIAGSITAAVSSGPVQSQGSVTASIAPK